MHRLFATAIAVSAFALTACSGSEEAPGEEAASEYNARQYMQAINDIGRLDDQEQDAARKPGELLAFAQIDRGDVVGDFIMGGGYVTRLLATAVGADGKVYAFQPEEFIAFRPEYATEQDETVRRYSDNDGNPINIFPVRGPLVEPGWPEQLDTIITVMNFHDLYLDQFPEGTAEQAIGNLYDALKPGGTLILIDHVASEGGGVEAANTLHRLDPQMAMDALTAAGFVSEAESDIYSQPDDPLTANVFDDEIRGQTDQIAWRFVKPE
ncbi:class I SAM-dependent methyltransferase [Aurantiacibacter sediminis]|uniref:Class I SAM-dependent methyltransferase n=1 Tax=Aurantiacibacter sediminis TaxID=2793064 RepID=A0ABS0N0Y3_9SPHN|nr:class I SAM-dependent methyltransferase [Aurantiacibacter sediminis]MBH5321632.1 class I SAM-dependent methyltransferase [Aurantiacibacter sediminis]